MSNTLKKKIRQEKDSTHAENKSFGCSFRLRCQGRPLREGGIWKPFTTKRGSHPSKTWKKNIKGKGVRNFKVPKWDFGTSWRTHQNLSSWKAQSIYFLHWIWLLHSECGDKISYSGYILRDRAKVRWVVSEVWRKERS